ncbi:hypothetical protein FRX31_024066 [Thalictrum thalictroides]|uniref:Uncharacterized protein n=1 Tax=Thalictrum thalictroides TaxID=46969 RepID=A0A7J6VNM1_THATH|nr:hypothetical protein FRX31_024066 [Thalictrum thalictroides]
MENRSWWSWGERLVVDKVQDIRVDYPLLDKGIGGFRIHEELCNEIESGLSWVNNSLWCSNMGDVSIFIGVVNCICRNFSCFPLFADLTIHFIVSHSFPFLIRGRLRFFIG